MSDGEPAPSVTTTTIAPGTTTTAPASTSTTSTLPPAEVCDNCADDDGDGLVDLDDPGCCPARTAAGLSRGTIAPAKKGAGSKIGLAATVAEGELVRGDAALPDLLVQIGPPGGIPLLCAALPGTSLKLRKGRLRFRDQGHNVPTARGLDRLDLARRRNGSARLVLGARAAAFAPPAAGALRLTVAPRASGVTSACVTADATFRAGRKKLRIR